MSSKTRIRGAPLVAVMLVAVIATALLVMPLVALAEEAPYRAETGVYNEEGFGLARPFLPYTEGTYRAWIGIYDEEGFGFLR